MKTATAPEICNTIMNHFIGYFGTPIRIVCDQTLPLCLIYVNGFCIHMVYMSPLPAQPTISPLWLSMELRVYHTY